MNSFDDFKRVVPRPFRMTLLSPRAGQRPTKFLKKKVSYIYKMYEKERTQTFSKVNALREEGLLPYSKQEELGLFICICPSKGKNIHRTREK